VNGGIILGRYFEGINIMMELAKHPVLNEYVLSRCKDIEPLLGDIGSVFCEYTDHSLDHSVKVLALGDKLLDKNSLSVWEIAVFVLTAFYHDIGMNCTQDEIEKLTDSQDFNKLRPYLHDHIVSLNQLKTGDEDIIEKFIKLEYLRRMHGFRSYEWIMKNYSEGSKEAYVENVHLWRAVALACLGHCLSIEELNRDNYSTEFFIGSGITIDLLFITCLLRLGDICHFSRDRALPYIRNGMDFYSQKSHDIWCAYGEIHDTIPLEDHGIIKIAATCSDFRWHRAIIESAKGIDIELARVHKILFDRKSKYKFPWKFVDTSSVVPNLNADYFYTDDHFRMNFERITELLIGSRLYRDELYALRECIQNSLDAISVYKIKDKHSQSYLAVQYQNHNKKYILEIFDNGTGMDQNICSRHLLSIGTNSFWFTERSCTEWGQIPEELSLIATHGIGFLSTFMIADKVEVYSKYPDQKQVHMVIDSFKSGVIYKTTPISDFPVLNSKLTYSSPWQQGHGTCIRLHLRNGISKLEIMEFFAQHIIRTSVPVTLSYDDEVVELPQIWHFGHGKIKFDGNLAELKENLFYPCPKDFYDNPPKDDCLNRGAFKHHGITGKVYPIEPTNSLNYRHTRLSQNGILVTEGHAYLLQSKFLNGSAQINQEPFFFDIDLKGNLCFELDAERGRIIDTPANRKIREDVVRIIIKEYFRTIALIESTMYFPCGGQYYHGAEYLFSEKNSLQVSFHKPLKEYLTIQKLKDFEFWANEEINLLQDVKLYALLDSSSSRNTPISVGDIDDITNCIIFVPTVMTVMTKLDTNINRQGITDWLLYKQEKELSKLCKSYNVVILPGFPDTFVIPLLLRYNFEVLKKTSFYFMLKPVKESRIGLAQIETDIFEKLAEDDKSKQINKLYKAKNK